MRWEDVLVRNLTNHDYINIRSSLTFGSFSSFVARLLG